MLHFNRRGSQSTRPWIRKVEQCMFEAFWYTHTRRRAGPFVGRPGLHKRIRNTLRSSGNKIARTEKHIHKPGQPITRTNEHSKSICVGGNGQCPKCPECSIFSGWRRNLRVGIGHITNFGLKLKTVLNKLFYACCEKRVSFGSI